MHDLRVRRVHNDRFLYQCSRAADSEVAHRNSSIHKCECRSVDRSTQLTPVFLDNVHEHIDLRTGICLQHYHRFEHLLQNSRGFSQFPIPWPSSSPLGPRERSLSKVASENRPVMLLL